MSAAEVAQKEHNTTSLPLSEQLLASYMRYIKVMLTFAVACMIGAVSISFLAFIGEMPQFVFIIQAAILLMSAVFVGIMLRLYVLAQSEKLLITEALNRTM